LPRLWEAIVDVVPTRGDAIVACQEVATTRQVTLPALTGEHHAQFAVRCARAALEGGLFEHEFGTWAETWLVGQDSSGVEARALADMLEVEGGSGLVHPEVLMAANAARAAAHASRLSWLAGRARDEENTRAVDLATQAVHTALRMTRLDLPSLADQALPKFDGSAATRPPVSVTPNRILRALPT
jgi:hypothetical protein